MFRRGDERRGRRGDGPGFGRRGQGRADRDRAGGERGQGRADRERYGGGRGQARADRDHGGRGRGGRGGGTPTGRGRDYQTKTDRVMGYRRLADLVEKNPYDIISELSQERSGFKNLLDVREIMRHDLIVLIIHAVAKAVQCVNMPETLIALLNFIQFSNFLTAQLSVHLTQLKSSILSSERIASQLKDILAILTKLLERLPSSEPSVTVVFSTLEFSIRELRGSRPGCITDEIDLIIDQVRDQIERIRKRMEQRPGEKVDRGDSQAPPEDFRELEVIPQLRDIHAAEQPFLRVNKEKGSYRNLNHYLDVQFRLLREDFIAPLREGIASCVTGLEEGEPVTTFNKDIRLYDGVKVLYPVCTPNGLVHKIRFDTSKLRFVRWKATKRLIYGSLVCLSKDNFRTLLFATVADRNPEELQMGNVYITFEDEGAGPDIDPSDLFIMAETSAYFEAYRHVLRGLQEVTEETLPFQDYIVQVLKDVGPPRYLNNRSPVYDLRPIADTEASILRKRIRPIRERLRYLHLDSSSDESTDEEETAPVEFKDDVEYASQVNIFQEESWPEAEQLNFDESQLRAVKQALTQEFAVIQGPPGTGKTYVGLKIIKALLHNKAKWQDEHSPILIVCYTNHALDQFLEGIQTFHDSGIVRVGGRSKSENLEKYRIANLRRNEIGRRTIPGPIRGNVLDSRRAMDPIEAQIDHHVSYIKSTEQWILPIYLLEEFMFPLHVEQITNPTGGLGQMIHINTQNAVGIMEWLGIGSMLVDDEPQANEEVRQEQGGENAEEWDEQEAIDVAEDAELLEEERKMEEDDEADQHAARDRNTPAAKDRQIRAQGREPDIGEFTADDDGLWEITAKERKKRKERKRKELRKHTVMTDEEVAGVHDIWDLPLNERWRLYRTWLSKYKDKIKGIIRDKEREFKTQHTRYVEAKNQQDLFIMQNSTIVGITTTGAARYWHVLQQIRPKIVIVEEAAEVLEAHIVTTLSRGCEHLILIGDHQQLKPNPTVYKLAVKYNLDLSLFERMIRNGMECVTLELQHRMSPEIAALMRPIYRNLRNHPSVSEYPNVKGVSKNVFFVNHDRYERQIEDSKSKSNRHEALYLAALCRYLLLQGYKPEQITVLATYSGQLFALKKCMPRNQFEGVRVCIVDNFQGEENDIILLSLVRSNKEGQIGFLKSPNRVCVALSRAKMGFYVIGNISMLSKDSDLWSQMMNILGESNNIGPALPLYCQNHPDEARINAACAEDFQRAPEGGCMRPCEFRLKCGHACNLPCHILDPKHTEYRCNKPCRKVVCDVEGHFCQKRCHEKCGTCTVQVEKVAPKCGHVNKVECGLKQSRITCMEECESVLPCGHQCQERCGHPCNTQCPTIIEKEWEGCKHRWKVPCSRETKDTPCPHPCRALLECGHQCSGTCGGCRNGRLHKACTQPCGRTLVCGHVCKELCTKNCPPCKEKCVNRCPHSKCQQKCGVPCVSCKEPCGSGCRHYSCTKLCGDPCDNFRCNQYCRKRLRCGHQCIGICGEQCPRLCRICNYDMVTTIMFGNEDDPNAQFIQLADCGHVIERRALDQWVDQDAENDGPTTIQPKVCPVCKTPIRKSARYRNEINSMMNDITKVKERIFGAQVDIDTKRNELLGDIRRLRRHGEDEVTLDRIEEDLENDSIDQDGIRKTEHQIDFLERLSKWQKKIKEYLLKTPDEKLNGVLDEIDSLQQWNNKYRRLYSDQEVREADLEITRLACLFNFIAIQSLVKRRYPERTAYVLTTAQAIRQLSCGKALDEENKNRYKTQIETLRKDLPDTGLGISEDERRMIVKAMSMGQGHWYKCRNDHVYAIGDCGGATMEATCPECKEAIGGTGHRVRDDNRVASEMDGATAAAWPNGGIVD